MKKIISIAAVLLILTSLLACSTNHTLIHNEAKAPTCIKDGNIEYWQCYDCNKYFTDAEGRHEVGNVKIAATGHKMSDGVCTVCGYVQPPAPIDVAGTYYFYENNSGEYSSNKTSYYKLNADSTGEAVNGDDKTNFTYELNGFTVAFEVEGKKIEGGIRKGIINTGDELWAMDDPIKVFGDIEYTVGHDGYFMVTSRATTKSELTVPGNIDGITVTKISDNVFNACADLTSVTIESGIKEIGARAFEGCTSLNALNIGEGVEILGEKVFADCTALTRLELPSTIKEIGDGMVSGAGVERIVFRGTIKQFNAISKSTNWKAGVKDGCQVFTKDNPEPKGE